MWQRLDQRIFIFPRSLKSNLTSKLLHQVKIFFYLWKRVREFLKFRFFEMWVSPFQKRLQNNPKCTWSIFLSTFAFRGWFLGIKKFDKFCGDTVGGKKNTHAKMFFKMFIITEIQIFQIFIPPVGCFSIRGWRGVDKFSRYSVDDSQQIRNCVHEY